MVGGDGEASVPLPWLRFSRPESEKNISETGYFRLQKTAIT